MLPIRFEVQVFDGYHGARVIIWSGGRGTTTEIRTLRNRPSESLLFVKNFNNITDVSKFLCSTLNKCNRYVLKPLYQDYRLRLEYRNQDFKEERLKQKAKVALKKSSFGSL